jgi:hypothetical protein
VVMLKEETFKSRPLENTIAGVLRRETVIS